MKPFREQIEAHPLPWYLGSVVAAFVMGVASYQTVLSWSGMKVVRDEAVMRLSVRIEPTPSDAEVSLGSESGKFFQGIPLSEGANEYVIKRDGYRSQTVRIARNGSTLIVSAPLTRNPSLASRGSVEYKGELVSMRFESIDIRAIFQILSDFTATNFVLGKDVHGTISIGLIDVPWDQAVDLIAARAGLEVKKSGNVVLIDNQ